jgi:hypothetical protein
MEILDLADEAMIKIATKIVEEAQSRGIYLRIMGALAIFMHSMDYIDIFKSLKRLGSDRRFFTDIDLIGYSKQRGHIRNLMEKYFNFAIDRYMLLFYKDRMIYYSNDAYHIDVFLDKLCFSHDIDLRGRLELDYPTITLADLLLEKFQIHEINEKDIKDVIILLRAHKVGDVDGKDILNAKRIAKVLSNDWGFWYDFKINTEKVLHFLKTYVNQGIISIDDAAYTERSLMDIIEYVDKEPKTNKWMKRAKEGEKKKWWRDVEERIR